ncbi:MAG: hypothetical protein II855_09725, partial [Candidatus Methanomethylophilaceae archaeon]|nr:hypothetical protein [Candidatus Methanomethylophilaceae archaeon]
DEWAKKILTYVSEHCPKTYGFDSVDMSDMGISYNLADKHFEKYCEESGYYPPYEKDEETNICGKTVWEKLDELTDDQLIIKTVKTKRGIAEILRFIHGYDMSEKATSAWSEVPPETWLRKIVRYLKKQGLDRDAIEDSLAQYGVEIMFPIYDDLPYYEPDDVLDEIAGPCEGRPVAENIPKRILGRPLVKITDYPSIDIPADIAEMSHDSMVIEIVKLSRYLSDVRNAVSGMDDEDKVRPDAWMLFDPSDYWYDKIESQLEKGRSIHCYGVSTDALESRHPGDDEHIEYHWAGTGDNDYSSIENEFTADPWRFLDIQDDAYLRYRLTVLREETDDVKDHIRAIRK